MTHKFSNQIQVTYMLKIQSNFLLLFFLGMTLTTMAQADHWQQRAEYQMDIDFDARFILFDVQVL